MGSGKPAGSSPWRPDRPPLTGCIPLAVLSTGGVPVPGVVLDCPRVTADVGRAGRAVSVRGPEDEGRWP